VLFTIESSFVQKVHKTPTCSVSVHSAIWDWRDLRRNSDSGVERRIVIALLNTLCSGPAVNCN